MPHALFPASHIRPNRSQPECPAVGVRRLQLHLLPAQLRFVNQLIEYLARNGTIDVAGLYESPFSSLAPGGPETLFPEADVVAMIAVIHSIRETATTRQQTG
ncbi:hypothetical protein [Streptomyces sp. NPDC057582]|uniref:hypothetical protein n=1 Tax=Streptomyces sp. NPDC057582 TaxID=3346174 RepID=UPI00368BEA53